ncbi:adenosinetriphosphatase [Exophiala viscosa]|uniref:Adenosinetriphosphatase n=1 Tax=Exophiala viscosa TaxID=2486360 RepID=A0AAN6DY82_9EURO|nr:adenosinetriphosphatase [Exophiala viscosa]
MECRDEPARKRRKLSKNVADDLPASFMTYLPIARATISVRSVGLASATPHPDTRRLQITVQSFEESDNGCTIDFTVDKSRIAKHACLQSPSAQDKQILRDILRLESAVRHKPGTALPLATASAILYATDNGLEIEAFILWEDAISVRDRVEPILLDVLGRYLPADTVRPPIFEPWEPRQFYDNVHVPEKSAENSAEFKVPALESQLFPFQRRGVRWLLSREGVSLKSSGEVQFLPEPQADFLPAGFEQTKTWKQTTCFVNHTMGIVSTDLSSVQKRFGPFRGGILADEMGLGKTLEVISLISLHRKPAHLADPPGLKQSSATLIITPPTILEQWKQEIQEHAPALRVYHYQGVSSYKKTGDKLIHDLLDQDVVLTTYNVIAKEVHYVAEKPDRNLRRRQRVEPPKSPLTQISWWRVCLDEAQMVESGVSSAATVARLIPRVNAWAVTGTPLRKGHRDLYGLLLFLRYMPWATSARLWDHLISYHRPLFRDMLSAIAMRHTKDFVREDLRLPPQSRHTITIPFTPIEEQHYAQLFQQLCEDCGLDRTGAPQSDDWDPDSSETIEKMRTWLTRLRQTCLHPEVGGRNRRALGRSTNGPLRTVQQVLDVMIDQHEGQVRTVQRSYLMTKIKRGQLKENARTTEEALKIWDAVYEESCVIVGECRKQFEEEQKASNAAEKMEDDDEEANARLTTLRTRLRSALEIQHIAIFFTANAYFQLKSLETEESDPYVELEKKETAAYEAAKSIRGELLTENLRHVNKLITNVRTNLSKGLTTIPDMEEPDDFAGIESRKIFDKLGAYCEVMNIQAEQFRELRRKMADFLSQALIDQDEGVELQGDEYESSTKHQDEMYAYMEALRALFADRGEAITGQENTLIKSEMKQFLRSAKEGEGPAPELMLKLLAEREQKRVKVSEFGCLRGIIAEIRQMVISLQWQEGNGHTRAGHELAILERVLKYVQQLNTAQTKALTSLEQEVNQFRDTMNSRLDYYRALQKISDTVAPYQEENVGKPLSERHYHELEVEEAKHQQKVVSLSAKLRYLLHMKNESRSSAPRICTICTDQFEVGTMTSCGHQFCKDCVLMWWSQHRNCPVCKSHLHPNSFHDISYKPAEIAVQAESPTSSPSTNSASGSSDHAHDQSIYSDISTTMLNQIKNIDLRGPSFGSKIDFLCRHLLWLREHDPGSKSIIFSQYREFIDVLERAFTEYKISSTRFDGKNGIEKFKVDPAMECFLLHAKAQSAGLNLVVASHVFLCEPLINTAIELQAIARVHRIGQYRPTTVWMYLIADTVEESIYDISVSRRLAHLRGNKKGKGSRSGTATPTTTNNGLQENAIDAANSMELQAADLSRMLTSGRNGGEMVDQEDLWACLFGRVKKREEVMGGLADAQAAGSDVGRLLRLEAAQRRLGPDVL